MTSNFDRWLEDNDDKVTKEFEHLRDLNPVFDVVELGWVGALEWILELFKENYRRNEAENKLGLPHYRGICVTDEIKSELNSIIGEEDD